MIGITVPSSEILAVNVSKLKASFLNEPNEYTLLHYIICSPNLKHTSLQRYRL